MGHKRSFSRNPVLSPFDSPVPGLDFNALNADHDRPFFDSFLVLFPPLPLFRTVLFFSSHPPSPDLLSFFFSLLSLPRPSSHFLPSFRLGTRVFSFNFNSGFFFFSCFPFYILSPQIFSLDSVIFIIRRFRSPQDSLFPLPPPKIPFPLYRTLNFHSPL